MIKFKDYHWVLEGLAALVLLVAFVLMVFNGTEVGSLVKVLTGFGIIFFTLMRIKPIISSRDEKDYVLVMFTEILIDIVIGIILIFFADKVKDEGILSFSRLLGLVLFVRGVSHFWTTAKRYELHDIISFIVHVFFISFGFLFIWSDNLTTKTIVIILMIISILLSIFFTYRSYNGYNNYRIQKQNQMKMGDYLEKEKEDETEKIDEPEPIVEKKIDEPNDDNRPSVDIN